tara:strand:+ start:82 stop:609 length:528 start_codon:yes stop_codon:yes gene_type:complete
MASHLRIEDAMILPARLDWPSAVGNFILEFGSMEWTLLAFLKQHLPMYEFKRVRDLHFKDRMSATSDYLNEEDYPLEVQEAFARFVEDIEPIRKLRNQLAHGHLTMIQDHAAASGETPSKVTLSLPRDLDRPYNAETWNMEFSELKKGLQRLYELSGEMDRISKFEPETPNSNEP